MNRSDLPRVSSHSRRVTADLDKHGSAVWLSTYDWQSPLRSGGSKGPKGEHADPTLGSVLAPDPLALLHGQYKQLLRAKEAADAAVLAFHQQVLPIDPDKIDRTRRSTVPACIVCSGPAFPARRGMCDTDYRAWLRDDRPDLEGFKRKRQKRLEEEQRVMHEHEVAS